MKNLSLLLFDLRFQWRHGFYYVYIIVCACYWVLLQFIPDVYREITAVLLAFSDPAALGLILAGGMVLLERDQGVHDALFVTPIRLRTYLLSKTVSLSVLSLAAGWVIHLSAGSLPGSPAAYSAGIGLTSSFMTLLSIGTAARQHSVNGFILKVQAYSLPFLLPLLGLFDLWDNPIFLILPTEGTLRLLQYSANQASRWEFIYFTALLLIWNFAAYMWAYSSYMRNILNKAGEGGAAR